MNHLSILQSLLAYSQFTNNMTPTQAFPANELRFVLEYASPPDINTQQGLIATALNSKAFILAPLSDAVSLNQFLILRFPSIEQTLPQSNLFDIAYALCDTLNLVSVEPELGTDFYTDPAPRSNEADIESTAIGNALCWVEGPTPPDKLWALKSAGIIQAWSKSQGQGILIGHPDTGIAKHDEIEPNMLALEKSVDIVDGDANPEDPLRSGMANPGHGTGTGSVIASRRTGQISGAAPESKLVPIRCIEDVKVFHQAPVAAAIAHATKVGCHVISMSLGGIPSRALHAAVREAVASDLIVIAAAGNCVRTVVWPARYDEVIAVGGTNILDQTWKGSSRGSAVDISAPAEFVWRAQRSSPSDPTDVVGGGQGTSFATALTAGVAALWLSYHGRNAVIAEARRKGTTVQRLFKAALCSTARRPADWDEEDFGAGIVNAEALLNLSLEDIPAAALESVASTAEAMDKLLDEEFGPAPRDYAFPWAKYSAEVATIALSQAQSAGQVDTLTIEAKSIRTRPSSHLDAVARQSTDSRLQRFAEIRGKTSVSRSPVAIRVAPDLRRLQLALPKSLGLESAGGVFDAVMARDYLTGSGKHEQLKHVIAVLDRNNNVNAEQKSEIAESVEHAIDLIAKGELLSFKGQLGLESLVRLTGRPALRIRNNTIDITVPEAREWQKLIFPLQDQSLQPLLAKVGRIDVDGVHMGTGFVVGAGIIMTNRHVLQAFAAPVPRKNKPIQWVMTNDNVTIDFADIPSSLTASTRFRIKSVIGAGPDDISGDVINFDRLDAALLEVEMSNVSANNLPAALDLVRTPTCTDHGNDIFVIGYPARPSQPPTNTAGNIDMVVVDRLNALFGADYGTKYLSPGQVMLAAGTWPGDPQKWVFTHDATTLNGNSGSSVLSLNNHVGVVGLHFGGGWMKENYAHALGSISAGSSFLASAAIKWV